MLADATADEVDAAIELPDALSMLPPKLFEVFGFTLERVLEPIILLLSIELILILFLDLVDNDLTGMLGGHLSAKNTNNIKIIQIIVNK
jgi:hypothetical protein